MIFQLRRSSGARLRAFVKSILLFSMVSVTPLLSLNAQSIPGIFGGVTNPSAAYVELISTGGTKFNGTSASETLPLNGLRNFVFLYTNDSASATFIPAGTYSIELLSSSRSPIAPLTGSFNYNGSSYRASLPNAPQSGDPVGSLGIQGYASFGGSGFAILEANGTSISIPTLPNGFFSFYYDSASSTGFLPPGTNYQLILAKGVGLTPPFPGPPNDPCTAIIYAAESKPDVVWNPTDTVPGTSGYYVANAAKNLGNINITGYCSNAVPTPFPVPLPF